ncbi:class I SAM-dependent methyltransferase [Alphaproteobacteria bacterium]|nr:class I SAM-dependent methyltransferase [Alphaproteobacteria bacterium]
MKNIHYETNEIAKYFSENRICWDQFYPSEKKLFESIEVLPSDEVLDIGCGCGGLGLALNQKFDIISYTGVDINSCAIEAGQSLNSSATLICDDILNAADSVLKGRSFDLVCSLSCIDWNIKFDEMLSVAWGFVKPGGKFVATFRLCLGEGSNELKDSYQYINYEGKKEGEIAAYVVLNIKELMAKLNNVKPSRIKGTGYWGVPSPTAVTPHDSLCFAAFSLTKRDKNDNGEVAIELDLPEELIANLN